jgi:thiosulfate/3-mercaptopyruvate sulfurtransferase
MTEKVVITPAELSDMLKGEKIVLMDTRDPATYAAGHLPNAVNIHDIFTYLSTSTPEGVAAMRDKFAIIFGAAGLSGNETAVVYEQSMNTGFGQSCRGFVLLRYLGYPKVKILHGGFVAWTAAGLATSIEVTTPERKTFPVDPSAAGILVDVQSMKAAVADPNIVKLDTRDVEALLTLRPAGSLSRPKATFVTRLPPAQLPARAARQLPDQSTTLQVDSSPH